MASQMLRDVMTMDPAACTPQTPVDQAAQMMRDADTGIIPVVKDKGDERLVGVITDRDIVVRILAEGADPAKSMVEQVMTTDVATLGQDATVDDCVRLMADRQVRRVPIVTADGRLVGIVSQADLARASEEDAELEDEMAEMEWTSSSPVPAPDC